MKSSLVSKRSKTNPKSKPIISKSTKRVVKQRKTQSPIKIQSSSISTLSAPSSSKLDTRLQSSLSTHISSNSFPLSNPTTNFTNAIVNVAKVIVQNPQYLSRRSISTHNYHKSSTQHHTTSPFQHNLKLQSTSISSIPSISTPPTQYSSTKSFSTFTPSLSSTTKTRTTTSTSKTSSIQHYSTKSQLRRKIQQQQHHQFTILTSQSQLFSTTSQPIAPPSSSQQQQQPNSTQDTQSQQSSQQSPQDSTQNITNGLNQYSQVIPVTPDEQFDNQRLKGKRLKNRLTIDGDEIPRKMKQAPKPPKESRLKKFYEKYPALSFPLRTFIFLMKSITGLSLIFGTALLLASQMSSFPMLAQPVKDILTAESSAAIAYSLQEMAALGLIDLKLVPTTVLQQMADPTNLKFGIDPTTIIEKPEIGYFIHSAEVFNTQTRPSSNALPRYHDSFFIESDPLPDYLYREATRNQFTALTKSLSDVVGYSTVAMNVNLQMLPGVLQAYTSLYQEYPSMTPYLSQFGQNPYTSLERAMDILFMRNNYVQDTLIRTLPQFTPPMLLNAQLPSPTPDSIHIGATLQHQLLYNQTPIGAMIHKLDDRFIGGFRLPEELDPELLASCPFKEELLNIPDDIKNHPDKTMTGPLFQTYYNIFSRNQYFNMLVEENQKLISFRDQLMGTASYFGLECTSDIITGQDAKQLEDPALQQYVQPIKTMINDKVAQSSIPNHSNNPTLLNQTPLLPQPFHHFASTGARVEDSNIPIPRKFEDITPMTDSIINSRQLHLPPHSSTAVERFIVDPKNIPTEPYNIDTTSMVKTFGFDDIENNELTFFNNLPPRYKPHSIYGTNPQVPVQDIELMSRILTKLDVILLRNQYELGRIQSVAMAQNPEFGKQHQQRITEADQQIQAINDMVEQMMKLEAAGQNEQGDGEEIQEEKAWYQFW